MEFMNLNVVSILFEQTTKTIQKMFDIDTSMREIYENKRATEIVQSCLPEITNWMLSAMFVGERSICDLIREGLLKVDDDLLKEIDEKLKQVTVE